MRMSTCDSGGSLASDMGPASIPHFARVRLGNIREPENICSTKSYKDKLNRSLRTSVRDMMMCDVHELLLYL